VSAEVRPWCGMSIEQSTTEEQLMRRTDTGLGRVPERIAGRIAEQVAAQVAEAREGAVS
jgi:hypothetical protein